MKKSAGLRLVNVMVITSAYWVVREGAPASEQFEFALGAVFVVSYCAFARWDNAAQLCWDAGYCITMDHGIVHSV